RECQRKTQWTAATPAFGARGELFCERSHRFGMVTCHPLDPVANQPAKRLQDGIDNAVTNKVSFPFPLEKLRIMEQSKLLRYTPLLHAQFFNQLPHRERPGHEMLDDADARRFSKHTKKAGSLNDLCVGQHVLTAF